MEELNLGLELATIIWQIGGFEDVFAFLLNEKFGWAA
jgi:hypothetical protein